MTFFRTIMQINFKPELTIRQHLLWWVFGGRSDGDGVCPATTFTTGIPSSETTFTSGSEIAVSLEYSRYDQIASCRFL